MKSEIDNIVEKKALEINFTFQQHENQLIINADSERIQYSASL
jgi:hypothetical protein